MMLQVAQGLGIQMSQAEQLRTWPPALAEHLNTDWRSLWVSERSTEVFLGKTRAQEAVVSSMWVNQRPGAMAKDSEEEQVRT
jgi:hypothetical protein